MDYRRFYVSIFSSILFFEVCKEDYSKSKDLANSLLKHIPWVTRKENGMQVGNAYFNKQDLDEMREHEFKDDWLEDDWIEKRVWECAFDVNKDNKIFTGGYAKLLDETYVKDFITKCRRKDSEQLDKLDKWAISVIMQSYSDWIVKSDRRYDWEY